MSLISKEKQALESGFGKTTRLFSKYGGESGIRTHVTLSSKHAFQACAFSHSAISPARLCETKYCFTNFSGCRSGSKTVSAFPQFYGREPSAPTGRGNRCSRRIAEENVREAFL